MDKKSPRCLLCDRELRLYDDYHAFPFAVIPKTEQYVHAACVDRLIRRELKQRHATQSAERSAEVTY